MNIPKYTSVYLSILMIVLLVSLSSATVETLGTFKSGEAIMLKQICANCTYNNITSVTYPNGTQIIGNVPMTKTGSQYNYSLVGSNTLAIGNYIVSGIGDVNGVNTIWTYDFLVSRNGDVLKTSDSLLYLFVALIGLAMLGLFMYGGYYLPWNNPTDEKQGNILKVNWYKHLKIFCIAFSYITIMWILFLGYNVTAGYLVFEGVSRYLEVLYRILVAAFRPLFVCIIIFAVVTFIRDLRLNEKIKQGYGVYK